MKLNFLERAKLRSTIDLVTGCWNYNKGINKATGRPYLRYKGKMQIVSRAILLFISKIENTSLYALHTCDNGCCINPDHLFWGTQTDNMQDMAKKGRSFSQKHPEHIQGIKNPSVKLTEEQVKEIYKLAHEGKLTQEEIAKKFDIIHQQVSNIKLKKQWKHLLGENE